MTSFSCDKSGCCYVESAITKNPLRDLRLATYMSPFPGIPMGTEGGVSIIDSITKTYTWRPQKRRPRPTKNDWKRQNIFQRVSSTYMHVKTAHYTARFRGSGGVPPICPLFAEQFVFLCNTNSIVPMPLKLIKLSKSLEFVFKIIHLVKLSLHLFLFLQEFLANQMLKQLQ